MRVALTILFCMLSVPALADVTSSTAPLPLPTNLSNHTSAIGGTGWTNSSLTITPNFTTAPDGTSTATKLASAGGGSNNIKQNVTLSANVTYTASVYAQAGTGGKVEVGFTDNVANAFFTTYTFSGSTFSDGAAGVCTVSSHGAYPMPNSYFRVWITGVCTSVPNTQAYLLEPNNASNGNTVIVWGSQAEAASYPTSYRPN